MSGNQPWNQPGANAAYPSQANNGTYNAATSNIPPVPTNVPLPGGMQPQQNGAATPAKPHKSKTRMIVIIAAVVVVLTAAAAGGFYYYSSNSHNSAVSQYGKAVNNLADAKSDLKTAIKRANSDTEDIHKGQVKDPDLFGDYQKTLKTARKLSDAKAADTIADTSSASTKDLKQATQSLNNLIGKVNGSASSMSKVAKKLVDSKSDADDVLKPIEREVAAAEKQKKANDEEAANSGIDMTQIKRGDYSSLDGTWTNPGGAWMNISNGQLTPQNPFSGTTPPYTLRECGGLDSQCMSYGDIPSTEDQLVQGGAYQYNEDSPSVQEILIVAQKNSALNDVAPSSYTTIPDPTDQSKDRIIPIWIGTNQGQTPFCSDSGCAYYRSGGGEASDASKQKLKSKVNAANDDIAKMDDAWEEEAKANFQCRVDVVNGAQKTCSAIGDSDKGKDNSGKSGDTKASTYVEPSSGSSLTPTSVSVSNPENRDSNHQAVSFSR
ncbi:DUF6287 domain-containing protein [Bifidobacterium sp. ESL0784]|uniref:DUF6287 domain-containing protein n=1 Tax=Bifidobacterium sp. ESL0784 TaxID=2983231 RepID=UPI0023F670B6|nr:DUF6287 domain-containing protein [Bifidobacterium sp. ESL0784]MDF7641390.1 DUF6287 domain-containing protein [Bifidobacterium sp. ESL0784]